MIVIDVGCARYGGDESIPYLIEEWRPWLLIGLDPAADPAVYTDRGCTVSVSRAAAWTRPGTIGFKTAGLRGHIDPAGEQVPCVDLADFINRMPFDKIGLKLDVEGAEYDLIPHLVAAGVDMLRLTMAWVEYHCKGCGRGGGTKINHMESCPADPVSIAGQVDALEATMRCEMHRWNR